MSATDPRLGPAGRIAVVTRLVIADSVPPGASSVPDSRVVRSCDPWPTPQVSPGVSRDRCVANADLNVCARLTNGNGPRVRGRPRAIVRRDLAPPGPSSQAAPRPLPD